MSEKDVLREFDAPPPRDPARSSFVRWATRRQRASYLALSVPAAAFLGVVWRGSGPRVDAVAGALVAFFALLFAAYVESNVRAMRRLYRRGQISWGSVRRGLGSRWQVVLFADPSGRLRCATLSGAGASPTVPVITAEGTRLVGLVSEHGSVFVGRSSAS
jgi:hypothetical protein